MTDRRIGLSPHSRLWPPGTSRVAEWPGGVMTRPAQGRSAAARAAAVLISDFLEPLDEVRAKLSAIAAAGVTGHMVQLADPAEETLPYDGRIEFLGLDGPLKYLAKKSEALREDYKAAYLAHREALRQLARGLGWSFTLHRTDETPASALLPLHLRVSGAENRHGGRGSA